MQNPFHARWTAKGNNLCLGHWEIDYRGRPLVLDAERREKDMGTRGNFSFLDPDDPDLVEGLPEDDWILENLRWLADLFVDHGIPIDEAHMRWFYQAVNAEDWRCASCGGCL
ncbi:MAG: hypothetical protein ACOZCP_21310 [Pseudomonadota bacterium]